MASVHNVYKSKVLIKKTDKNQFNIMKQASLTGRPTILEQKRSFGPRFGPAKPEFAPQLFFDVSALLDVRYCSKLQSCAILRKTNDANLRK